MYETTFTPLFCDLSSNSPSPSYIIAKNPPSMTESSSDLSAGPMLMWLQTEPAPPDDHMSVPANPWDTAWTAVHPANVIQQAGSTEHEPT